MITNTSYNNFAKYYGKMNPQSFKSKDPDNKEHDKDSNAFPGLDKRDKERKKQEKKAKFHKWVAVPLLIAAWLGFGKLSDNNKADHLNKVDYIEMHSAGAKNLAIVEIANLLLNPKPIIISKEIDPTDQFQTSMDVQDIIQQIYEKTDDPKVKDLMRFVNNERSELRKFIKKYFDTTLASQKGSLAQRILVEDLVVEYLKIPQNDPIVAELSDKIQNTLWELKENINIIVRNAIKGRGND